MSSYYFKTIFRLAMCETHTKFHQNWWCGFWEKRSHKTNFCGFIYRIRLFLRRHISNSSINTNIASWSSYILVTYLTLQYWIIDKTSINIYLFLSSPRLCKNTKEPSYSDSVDCSKEGLEDQVSHQPKSPFDNDDIATTPPSSCLEVSPLFLDR